MAEWSIAAVLKTVDLHGSGGSNPSLSAENENRGFLSLYFFVFAGKYPPHSCMKNVIRVGLQFTILIEYVAIGNRTNGLQTIGPQDFSDEPFRSNIKQTISLPLP